MLPRAYEVFSVVSPRIDDALSGAVLAHRTFMMRELSISDVDIAPVNKKSGVLSPRLTVPLLLVEVKVEDVAAKNERGEWC